jgi:hypothetical protein
MFQIFSAYVFPWIVTFLLFESPTGYTLNSTATLTGEAVMNKPVKASGHKGPSLALMRYADNQL